MVVGRDGMPTISATITIELMDMILIVAVLVLLVESSSWWSYGGSIFVLLLVQCNTLVILWFTIVVFANYVKCHALCRADTTIVEVFFTSSKL